MTVHDDYVDVKRYLLIYREPGLDTELGLQVGLSCCAALCRTTVTSGIAAHIRIVFHSNFTMFAR
jgi:hypothetical protein